MNIFLVLMAIALFTGQTLAMKLVRAKSLATRLALYAFFTALATLGMGAVMAIFPSLGGISPATLVFGFLFGVLFALTILYYNFAIASGPLSHTTFYFSASMLIPAAAGLVLFHEPVRAALFAALALFLAAFYFLNAAKPDTARTKKWYLYCLLSFLFNGLSAVVQKGHQTIVGNEASGLMLVGFFTAFIAYCACALVFAKKKRAKVPLAALAKENTLSIALLAIASLGGNVLLTYLAGQMSGSYLFPLVQGSIVICVSIISVLFFREKLNWHSKLGIALGVCAIVTINL